MAQIEKSAILITKTKSGDELWIYPITTADNVMYDSTNQLDTIVAQALADIEDLKNRKATVDSEIDASSQNPVQNSTIYLALNGKVDKVSGKGLSTNDYTTAEKGKLEGVATSATRNIIDSSLTASGTNAVQGNIIYAEIQRVNNKIDNIITDAPEAFDTFKEVAEYISEHRDEYDALLAITSNKVDKVSGKGLSANDFTDTLKTKLDSVEEGAEVNQNSFSYIGADGTTAAASSKTDTLEIEATGAASVSISGKTLTIGATNTTYAEASSATAGLMSSSDKSKLDTVATSAEVNQNAISKIKVGSTTVESSSKTDTVEIKGSGDTTVSASGKVITINSTDTTYADATTAASGLMSSSDKTKLNGIATGAEVNQNAFSNVVAGSTTAVADDKTDALTVEATGAASVSISGKTLTIGATNTTYDTYKGATASAAGTAGLVPAATTATRLQFLRGDATWATPTDTTYATATTADDGLMSASDKEKLDGVTPGATTYANATTAASGLMSSSDKSKVDGIAEGAEVNQNAFSNVKIGTTTLASTAKTDTVTIEGSGSVSVSGAGKTVTIAGVDTTYGDYKGATGSAAGTAGLVPAATAGNQTKFLRGDATWQVPTNTTYAAVTTAANGLMTKEDKTKLNGIATGAEVNQNAFSNVVANGTTVAASGKTDSFEIEGSGSVSVSAANKKITVTGTDTTYAFSNSAPTLAWGTTSTIGTVGGIPLTVKMPANPDTNTTYDTYKGATSSATGTAGLVPPATAANRTKFLRGDATWQVPTNTTYAAVTTQASGLMSAADKIKLDGITDGATTYAEATTAASGLMSSSDKTKLNGIAEGANKTIVDSAMSSTSTNPVQNAVVYNAIKAVSDEVSAMLENADTAYDTFKEISDWIGTHEDDFEALQNLSNNKVDKVEGKGLSTNDFTDALLTKLNGIATGAEVNQNAFSNVVANGTTVAASGKTDTLTLSGSGSVSVSASGKTVTISGTDTTYAFSNSAPTLAWDTTSTIGTVGGVALTVKMPANPDTNTTYDTYKGATASAAGTAGLVPPATAANRTKFLRGDATWATPTNTTYAVVTTAANGLVPKLAGGTTCYLRADGTWTVPTDTTYAEATTATAGLMSSSDKSKVNGIAEGAEVNQNAFSNVVANGTTVAASGKTDSFEIEGSGSVSVSASDKKITVTGTNTTYDTYKGATASAAGTAGLVPAATTANRLQFLRGDATWATPTNTTYAAATSSNLGLVKIGSNITNSSGTISISKANVTAALGYTPPTTDTNTTYADATTAASGLMSSSDKTKLDGIEDNANNYVHPTATSHASGMYKVAIDGTGHVTAATAVSKSDITGLGIPSSDTTYDAATASSLGLVKTGSNITNSSGTISVSKANVTAALGYEPPTTNTTYAVATTAANGLMSKDDKTKLDGIEDNANNYVHPTATSHASGMYKVAVDGTGHVTAATAVAKADITGLGIPDTNTTYGAATTAALGLVKIGSNITNSSGTISISKANVTAALGYTPPTTNTTYAVATTAANGLMSKDDKTKLNGVATGAEVNQNAFSNVVANGTTVAASGKTDSFEIEGSGSVSVSASDKKVTIAGTDTTYGAATASVLGLVKIGSNISNSSGTISLTKANVTAALGYTPPSTDTNTTYAAVTTSANGLMTAADKIKLNGIAEGANNYVHPTATAKASGLYKVAVDGTGHVTAATAVAKADITGLGIPDTNTTYANYVGATASAAGTAGLVPPATTANRLQFLRGDATWQTPTNTTYAVATTGANGLMSSADKAKLDGVAEGANNYVHPTATSKASGMYKVAVDGTGHVTAATAVAKADITALGIPGTDTTYAAATDSALGLVKIGSNITNSSGTISISKANVTAALGYTPPTTNTTYAVATTAANGLMSKDDKTKLNGVATGAEVNQNAFSNVVVGETTAAASAKTDSLTVKASGAASVSLSGKELTIDAVDTTYANYVGATASAAGTAGLVPPATAANRTKFLRGDATWQTPTNTTYAAATTGANGLMSKDDKAKLDGITSGATSYAAATQSADGLMSSADKTKLDGVETGANKTVVDTAMSTTSTNPVQNKVVDAAIKAVETRVTTILDGADTAFDTFKEISDWIGTHETEFEALQDLSANKVDKVEGKGLSTNDYTTTEKNKLAGIATGAEVNQNAFSNVKVGSTTAAAGAKTDTLEITGSGSVTVSASGKKITVSGTNTTYAAATTGANGLMSSADKTKLDGITEGATTYAFTNGAKTLAWNTTSTIATVGGVDITVKMPANPDTNTTYGVATTASAGLAPKLSGGTTSYLRGDGTWQVPTNTTYATVTTAANGLMTKEDKIKLNGVATGAEVNQNAFSNVVVGTTTAAAGDKTDSLTVKASGAASVSLSGKELTINSTNTTYGAATGSALGLVKIGSNITNSSGTISLSKANVTAALGYTPPTTDTNTTYAAVTTAANGLMTKEDKTKLDGIDANANNYTHPTATSQASGLYKITVDGTGHVTAATAVAKADITGLGIPDTNTTYAAATGSALGLVKIGSNITNSSGTISLTKANVTAALGYTPPSTDTNTTYANYVGATTAASGTAGLVPAATTATRLNFLRGDGTWAVPTDTDTTYAAATGSALGLVKIGSNITNSSGTISLTKANVTAALGYTPPTTDTNTTYAAATDSALGLVKIGSNISNSSGTISLTKANVTAALGYEPPTTDTNTTYANYVGATASAAGTAGLVPPATAGNQTKFLRGDATWQTPTNTTYAAVTTAANGLMTAADKIKLNGIAEGANNYVHPTATSKASGLYKVAVDGTGHVTAATAVAKADITGLGIPAQDTTYAAATDSALGLVKIGSNISNSSGTISLTKANVTAALGYEPPTTDTNTTYANYVGATASAAGTAGLVPPATAGNQTKFLRGDATWQVPTNTTYGAATTADLGLVKIGSNITNSSGTISIAKANVTAALGYTPPTTNTTYAVATTAVNGLMSAADKIKLDTMLDLVSSDKNAGSTDLIYGLILEIES